MTRTLANSSDIDWRKRPATDFYPTPPDVTQALINYMSIERAASIWECACGDNHMVNVFRENGYVVRGTDIKDGTDFMLQAECQENWIITNPPFILSEAFIRHAAELRPDGFAMLLKSQYWHSAGRLQLFREIPPVCVLPLSWRPDFLFGKKSSSPTMEVLWTVWIDPHGEDPTIYEPLPRPCRGSVASPEQMNLTTEEPELHG